MTTETEMVLLCPHCGSSKIDEDDSYCFSCGEEFDEPDEGAVVDPDSRWNDRRIEPREE